MIIINNKSFPTKGNNFSQSFYEYGTRDDIKLNGKKIIACIGCSHTYGHTTSEFTFPNLLQQKLTNYQVLNCGRRNYGMKLIIDWYHCLVEKANPEIVIIQIPLFCRQPFPEKQPNESLYYTMEHGSYALLNKGMVSPNDFISSSLKLIETDLKRLNTFVNELKTKTLPIVLFYKSYHKKFWFMHDLASIQYKETINMCKKNNHHIIYDRFMNVSDFKKKNWLCDYTHPNNEGNAFISEVIYDFFKQNQVILS